MIDTINIKFSAKKKIKEKYTKMVERSNKKRRRFDRVIFFNFIFDLLEKMV